MFITKKEYDRIKIQPYEPCPCGSDDKFKFCCYQKARIESEKERKSMSYTYSRLNHMATTAWRDADFDVCLGFNQEKCSGSIKNAHTLQNNRILNRIQEHGHVYRISGDLDKKLEFRSVFKKISRNKASTFRGFCDYHDTILFREIEQEEYANKDKQNFLFAFRSLTLQYHEKLRLLNQLRSHFKKYPAATLDPQMVNTYRVTQLDIQDYGMEYKRFKDDYLNRNFRNLRTIYTCLDYEINFATSASFAVQHDLKQNLINDIYFDKSSDKMPSIYINIYPTNGKTNIIISHHRKDSIYKDYFDQLEEIPLSKLVKYLNFLVIQYTQNIYFKPSFIDNMDTQEKENLLKSFSSSIDMLNKIELLAKNEYFKFNIFRKVP